MRTGPILAPAQEKAKRGRNRPAIAKPAAADPDPKPAATPDEDAEQRDDNSNGARATSHFAPPKQTDDFWQWLSQFTADEWSYLIVYLWRVSPSIDTKSGGKPSNIRKFSTSFDIDTIREEEGSGHYRLDVCQVASTGAGSTRIAQHFFKILNMKYPPNVPPGDWLQRPENKEWAWAAQAIEANARRMGAEAARSPIAMAAAGDHNGSGNTVAMFTTFDESMRRVLDMASPSNLLATMKDYRDMFMPAAAPPTGQDPAMLMLVGMFREELAATRTELKELRAKNADPIPRQSFKEQLGDLKDVMKDLRDMSPRGQAGGTGEGPNWENVIATALPEVTKITSNLVDAFVPKRPAAPQAQTVPIVQQPQTLPTQTQEGTPPPMSELATRLRDNAALLYMVVPVMADHFRNRYGGSLETAAQAFQEWMFASNELGKPAFDKLRATFSVNEIFDQVTTVPMLKGRFVPVEDVRPFLEAVYTDWEEEGSEAAGPAPETTK